MPAHDWTHVEAGIFHAFHTRWISELQGGLNDGLLTQGYYALAEQHFGHAVPDILTLHASDPDDESSKWDSPDSSSWSDSGDGGAVIATAEPRTRFKQTIEKPALTHRRTIAIRHVSGHRLVAIIEIVSPGNKDRAKHVEEFANKIEDVLDAGVHVLLVDLLPPGTHDPSGLHDIILHRFKSTAPQYELPPNEPLTLASYCSGYPMEIYLEHLAVGASIPEMPLFLTTQRYVNVPLEATYQSAYSGMPAFWRQVLEK